MFTITAKGVYGLTAMTELSKNFQNGPLQIKEIAESYSIPQHYLEQILVALKKGGLVESFRGAQGGYALAKSPEKIRVIDILTLLEGKLEVSPESRGASVLSFFWDNLERLIGSYLEKGLDELVQEIENSRTQIFYSI
ncbi:MAG: Rrf2 family transcriptional regulator [Spirochaetales bacterium]|nr:Rrf2 family transcriptional regulator [Spirochaetales bacterium]